MKKTPTDVSRFPAVSGVCPVTHDTIDFILSRNGTGNAVVIAVGGAAESLNSTPGVNQITLKNRKGFVRKALLHGYGGGAYQGSDEGSFVPSLAMTLRECV